MRTLTSAASTEANKEMGAEPVAVLKIEWGGTAGTRYYAGKETTIGSIVTRPQLTELASLKWQLKEYQSGIVSTFNVALDDSEGDLNSILDSMAVENRAATVYLHFEGNDEADLITLVRGKLVSPIEWQEGERTLNLTVESFVSESEVGFAPTELDYPTLPRESDGKTWPMCFGSPIHVPAVRIAKRGSSTLMGSASCSITVDEVGNVSFSGENQFTVEDGSDFPSGTCAVNIGGIVFRGFMFGNTFTINNLSEGLHLPKFTNIRFTSRVADADVQNAAVGWLTEYRSIVNHYVNIFFASTGVTQYYKVIRQQGRKVWFSEPVTNGAGSYVLLSGADAIQEVAYMPLVGWPAVSGTEPDGHQFISDPERGIVGIQWNFTAGTKMLLWEDYTALFYYTYGDVWVCNSIPSTGIHAVFAERTINGVRGFAPVPTEFYQKWTSVTLFGRTVSAIYLPHAMSEFDGQGWGDQLYVTLTSSQGPNVSNVLKYLLDEHSEFDTDATSFSDVATAVANYPVNFALLDKRSTLEVCEEIAWQARCALIYTGDTVKVKYLSVEPSSDQALEEVNLLNDSIKLSYSPSEEIITRFIAEWRQNYLQEQPYKVINENNIAAFGLREETFEFYIYNDYSLVVKSAKFWSVRLGNSWQLAKLTSFLECAKLEPQDCTALELADETIFNSSSLKAMLHGQSYDLKRCLVELELWLPRVAGSTSVHAEAWLSDSGDTLPTSQFLVWGESNPVEVGEPLPKTPKLAKVVRQADPEYDIGVPWQYLINVYENGYDQPPTKMNIPVKVMDEAVTLEPEQAVTTVPVAGMDYIQTATGTTAVIATIGTYSSGLGQYTWTKTRGTGPDSGVAKELNASTGILAGTVVVLIPVFNTDTQVTDYWFFFPVENC